LERRFFDPEGDLFRPSDPLPLYKRRQLAELFLAVQSGVTRTVLVDMRYRLDGDVVACALVCNAFRQLGVRVIETGTGTVLTDPSDIQTVLAAADPEQVRKARRLVALFKGMAKRSQTGVQTGRKPFGSTGEEVAALARIRFLYRLLPRDQWRRRGQRVLKRRSFRCIANVLNAEGVPTRTGKPWSGSVVMGILKRLNRWWLWA
jgi:hypothetical protein